MARVIQFPEMPPNRHGYQKVRRKRRDPEEYGQLNLFKSRKEARIISLTQESHPFESALRAEEEGNNALARDYYSKAIQQNQQIADAYCNLGIIASAENKLSEALDFFTKSLVADPRHLEAHYNLANLYADLGNVQLGRVHYEVSIQIDPAFTCSYYNLALLLLEQGAFREAEMRLMQYNAICEPEERNNTQHLLKEIRQHIKRNDYE